MRGKGLHVILTDSGPHLGATHNFGYANGIQLLSEELLQAALCLRGGFSCDYMLKFPVCWSWSVYFFVSCWHRKSSFWPYRVKRPHMVLIKARCRSWWSEWTSRCRKRCCFSEVQDPRVLHCTCVTDLTARLEWSAGFSSTGCRSLKCCSGLVYQLPTGTQVFWRSSLNSTCPQSFMLFTAFPNWTFVFKSQKQLSNGYNGEKIPKCFTHPSSIPVM